MHRNIKGLATIVEHIVTIMSHRWKDVLYLLSVPSSLCMKWTMGTLVIGGSLLRIKLDFTFVMLVSLKSDIS